MIASSPVRATKDHRAGNVLRGRAGGLELVAFDVVYASGRHVVPEYAVTAAPVLGQVPVFRLGPARFWRHRTGGLVPLARGTSPPVRCRQNRAGPSRNTGTCPSTGAAVTAYSGTTCRPEA